MSLYPGSDDYGIEEVDEQLVAKIVVLQPSPESSPESSPDPSRPSSPDLSPWQATELDNFPEGSYQEHVQRTSHDHIPLTRIW